MAARRPWVVSLLAGLAGLIVFVAFGIAAYLSYPSGFAPGSNRLADLGNPELNPTGWILFSVGTALAGAALAVFFLGFERWAVGERSGRRRGVRLLQGIGLVGAGALVLSAVFVEGGPAGLHEFWALAMLESLAAFAFLSVLVLYTRRGFWKALAALGVATVGLAVAFPLAAPSAAMEWVAVGTLFGFIGLLAINTDRMAAAEWDRRVPGPRRPKSTAPRSS